MFGIGKLSDIIRSFTALKLTHHLTSPSFFFTGTSGELNSDTEFVITPFSIQSAICSSSEDFMVGFRGLTFCLIAEPGFILSSMVTRSVTPTFPSDLGVNTSAYLVIKAVVLALIFGCLFRNSFSSIFNSFRISFCLSKQWFIWLMYADSFGFSLWG